MGRLHDFISFGQSFRVLLVEFLEVALLLVLGFGGRGGFLVPVHFGLLSRASSESSNKYLSRVKNI